MSDSSTDELLRFGCQHCGVHLAVAISLAGIEGPCPRCGKALRAPELSQPSRIPTAGVTREVGSKSAGLGARIPECQEASIEPSQFGRAERTGRRRVSSSKRSSSVPGEKEAVKSALKIGIAVLIAILVFVAISWYLKNY